VQAAWALVRSKKGGRLKERFFYMTVEKSISKKKPVAAVARRLAELMYVLMRDGGHLRQGGLRAKVFRQGIWRRQVLVHKRRGGCQAEKIAKKNRKSA
jgi:hypothetical protein